MTMHITSANLCPALDDIINHLTVIRQSPDWKSLVAHPLSHPELAADLANCLTYAKQLYADMEASLEIIDEVEQEALVQGCKGERTLLANKSLIVLPWSESADADVA